MAAWTETTKFEREGWEVSVTTLPDHAYVKVRAIHRRRGLVTEVPKMSTAALADWSPTDDWSKR